MNSRDVAQRPAMLKILQQRLREDKRSDSEIARAANVSQPTVSRLRSNTKERLRWSKPFITLCSMYGVGGAKDAVDVPDYNALLPAAVAAAWDGTADTGKHLLAVIEALAHLINGPTRRARESHGHD